MNTFKTYTKYSKDGGKHLKGFRKILSKVCTKQLIIGIIETVDAAKQRTYAERQLKFTVQQDILLKCCECNENDLCRIFMITKMIYDYENDLCRNSETMPKSKSGRTLD